MATTQNFSNMINEFVSEELMFAELKKRDWFMTNLEQETNWLGGHYILPVVAANQSSVTFGSLAASTDIAAEQTVRGSIDPAEAWGSMIFDEMDLMVNNKVSEQNFLRILPDAIKRHLDSFKFQISTQLLGGGYIAKATADGTSAGLITVNDPERFQLGMKVFVDDDDSSPSSAGYVRAIDKNTGVLTIYDARTAGSVVNLSAYSVAQNAKIFGDGAQSNGFASMVDVLLSSANGGGASYGGVTKASYPHMQAINIDGSTVTASNTLSKIFDAYVQIRKRGGGKPFKVVMSYKNFGNCLKNLESTKGAFNVMQGSKQASVYGWDEIQVGGFAGLLDLVAVVECNDSEIQFLDLETLKFASNGGLRRRKSPDGTEYHVIRNTTGYQYILDHVLRGNLIVKQPEKNGILYGISYT